MVINSKVIRGGGMHWFSQEAGAGIMAYVFQRIKDIRSITKHIDHYIKNSI